MLYQLNGSAPHIVINLNKIIHIYIDADNFYLSIITQDANHTSIRYESYEELQTELNKMTRISKGIFA